MIRTTVLTGLFCAALNAAANPALPPAYGFLEHHFPEPNDQRPCDRPQNSNARLGRVALAQTHLMEPAWPFFYMAGGRPALVVVTLEGSGQSPDVQVRAYAQGRELGTLCLEGPGTLPGAAADPWEDATPNRASLYSATLPAHWVQPGLSLEVQAGEDRRTFSAEELKVRPPTEINLLKIRMDLLHYNDGKDDPAMRGDFLADFAASMPASRTRLGELPARLIFDRIIFAGDQDEPVLACRSDLADRSGCQDYQHIGGMDRLAVLLRFAGAVAFATGQRSYGFTYGNSLHLKSGGWGGNKNFAGSDYEGIFLHEMGHALGLPHWGEGPYGNTSPGDDDFSYPYGGINDNGGGRGFTWNYDPNTNEFYSPLCQIPGHVRFGLERSDAMQRSSACDEWRSGGQGPWDGFGDFSAFAIHEFLHGNEGNRWGTVSYRGRQADWHLPRRQGFARLQLNANGERELVREASQPTSMPDEERYFFLRPAQWDAPVYTVYGSYHPQYSKANLLYRPVAYMGTLPPLVDPTNSETFAELLRRNSGAYGDFFYWPKDLTLRFTYHDGTTLTAIYPYDAVSRNWSPAHHPWRWDLLYWAINIPADRPLAKVELFHRPFVVRGTNDATAGNIANPALNITPQNFLQGATLLSERTFSVEEIPLPLRPHHPVPGRLEAEHFASMAGVQTEECTDEGAGLNVGYLDAGDWMLYRMDSEKAANYQLQLRHAGLEESGRLRISQGTQSVTLDLAPTGGWQNWQTATASLALEAGEQELRIEVLSGGFNLNWIEFLEETPVSARPRIAHRLRVDELRRGIVWDLLGRR